MPVRPRVWRSQLQEEKSRGAAANVPFSRAGSRWSARSLQRKPCCGAGDHGILLDGAGFGSCCIFTGIQDKWSALLAKLEGESCVPTMGSKSDSWDLCKGEVKSSHQLCPQVKELERRQPCDGRAVYEKVPGVAEHP